MTAFMPVPPCLDYYSFAVSVEIESVNPSTLFFFEDCFVYSNSLEFPILTLSYKSKLHEVAYNDRTEVTLVLFLHLYNHCAATIYLESVV